MGWGEDSMTGEGLKSPKASQEASKPGPGRLSQEALGSPRPQGKLEHGEQNQQSHVPKHC